jgi:hypothetical protein
VNEVVAGVVVVIVLAVVVVVAVLASRGRFRGEVRGPGGLGTSVEGERARGARLRKVRAGRDVAGRGSTVDARGIDAGRDVTFEDRGEPGPKG